MMILIGKHTELIVWLYAVGTYLHILICKYVTINQSNGYVTAEVAPTNIMHSWLITISRINMQELHFLSIFVHEYEGKVCFECLFQLQIRCADKTTDLLNGGKV